MGTAAEQGSSVDAAAEFERWLPKLARAFESTDPAAVVTLFDQDSYWKDVLAFTWGYRTFGGPQEIERGLKATLGATRPRNVRPSPDRTPPRLVRRSAKPVVEAYFDFDTAAGRGTGFVRLLVGGQGTRLWILLTTLQELAGFAEKVDDLRPTGIEYSHDFAGENWLDACRKRQEFADEAPDVLVVGAGQAGLALAARLGQLGVDTLVVERNRRVGDNWRNRYHSLTLHNEVWANDLPYLPFPPTWPTFVPKDKLAGWLAGYAEFMELNVWTGTDFLGAEYDEGRRVWTARLRRADGAVQAIDAMHLVLATGGTSGAPNIPALPGLDAFGGAVMHSSDFTSGVEFAGRNAIVVGTGNSGHDVAQDLHSNGARVTMVQRHPTCVISLVPGGTMVYKVYSEGPPADDVDLITAAIPYPVLQNTYQWLTRRTCELDAEMIAGLNAAGFETDFGIDRTGFHMLYLRRGGGYYINVGCSNLIADGQIRVVQSRDSAGFTGEGLRMADGTVVDADLVVLATGYENQQESIRRLLGTKVADRVGPVWGFDENYIMRNMWQRTAHEHFWIMGGSLLDCRMYSRFLALQIKADLEGILPPETDEQSTRFDLQT